MVTTEEMMEVFNKLADDVRIIESDFKKRINDVKKRTSDLSKMIKEL